MDVQLIIIDSISTIFAPIMSNDAQGLPLLLYHMSNVRHYAETRQIPIIVVNGVVGFRDV